MIHKRIDLTDVFPGLHSYHREDIGEENPKITKHGDTPSLYTYLHDVCAEISGDAHISPAVIVCPGGGYAMTSEREGEAIALRYFARGYQVFVLRYSAYAGWPIPLCEACAAVAYVRGHADEFLVAPDKIAVIGFSAGGHLAASTSTLWHLPIVSETLGVSSSDCRPDASILCYPVITSGELAHRGSIVNLLKDRASDPEMLTLISPEKQVRSDTPPAFLWHTASDEVVPVENSLLYGAALSREHIPFEMHIYPKGPHGMANSDRTVGLLTDRAVSAYVAPWMELSIKWLDTLFDTSNMP